MVQIGNAVALTGDKVTNREMTLLFLDDLNHSDDSDDCNRLGSETMSIDDIHGMLLNREIRMNKNIEPSLESSLSANYVFMQTYNSNSNNFHSNESGPNVQKQIKVPS